MEAHWYCSAQGSPLSRRCRAVLARVVVIHGTNFKALATITWIR
jgi:hypothetical protein